MALSRRTSVTGFSYTLRIVRVCRTPRIQPAKGLPDPARFLLVPEPSRGRAGIHLSCPPPLLPRCSASILLSFRQVGRVYGALDLSGFALCKLGGVCPVFFFLAGDDCNSVLAEESARGGRTRCYPAVELTVRTHIHT